jgi:N-acetyltransferase
MSGYKLPNAPVTLIGQGLALHELNVDHADALWTVAQNPALWRYTPDQPDSVEALTDYIRQAQLSRKLGTALPFAIWHVEQQRYVGSTRLANMDARHRRAEIGWTWLDSSVQRSFVNRTCKRLLLDYAFNELNCIRVELKCSAANHASRRAIEALGAVYEGTLRAHMQMPDGSRRDTCYYSILVEEWAGLRDAQAFLSR